MSHLLDELAHLAARAQIGLPAEERPADDVLQILAREGLDEVLEGAVGEGVLHGLERGVRGDHHDFDRAIGLLHAPEQLEPVHLGHLDVHDHEVRPEPLERLKRGMAVLGRLDVVAGLQEHAERLARAELVVDDQDTRAGGCHGDGAHDAARGRERRNASSLRPGRTSSWPPMASTRR